jgi:flavodoxin
MKCKVVYASKTGNTKKVANAMAAALGVEACPIDAFDATEACDLLFLGGALYGGELSPEMKALLERLDPKKLARVAVFCTAVMGEKANDLMKGLLSARGIPVIAETFSCHGKFLWMNRKAPNADELKRAGEYAGRMTK